MRETLETARLVGSRIGPEHIRPLLAMYNEPRVVRWLGGPRSQDDWLVGKISHWDEHGYGDWVFREPGRAALVGRAGLRRVTIDGVPEVEVGYMVDPERWSQGFATEMTAAVLEAGFSLGLDEIVAFTLPENVASRRVMEKCGLTYEKSIEWAARPHVLYRIRKGSSSDG